MLWVKRAGYLGFDCFQIWPSSLVMPSDWMVRAHPLPAHAVYYRRLPRGEVLLLQLRFCLQARIDARKQTVSSLRYITVGMAADSSRDEYDTLEERLSGIELGFKKVRDYVFQWPLDAVENANAREILGLQSILDDIKRHVPRTCSDNNELLCPWNLKLEDRIKVMESNLNRMRDYLSSSPLEVIEVANAVAIADLRRALLEVKHDIMEAVASGSTVSPYACNCPNGFNAPYVEELLQNFGAQLRKMDKLKRDIREAISKTSEHTDLVARLTNAIEEEEDNFEDYEPPIPSPCNDYSYDSDRSPKGVW